MPAFLNTDNGRVIQVADDEAFIYDRASNFKRVKEELPAVDQPVVSSRPKRTTKKKV